MNQSEATPTQASESDLDKKIATAEMVDSVLDRLVVDPEIHILRGPDLLSPIKLVFRIPHIDPQNPIKGRSSMVSVALETDDPRMDSVQTFDVFSPSGTRTTLNFKVGMSWWATKDFCRILWGDAIAKGWQPDRLPKVAITPAQLSL